MNFTKISFVIRDKPPYFIGSQLRGALGYALKRVTCINPSKICEGCYAINECLYYEFFEEKNSFHKFRFDFELGKEFYDFSFYLFDNKVSKVPYIVSAFDKMLKEQGLGVNKKTYKDFDCYINNNTLDNQKLVIPNNYVEEFKVENIFQKVTINIKTPLRIKKNNRFIRDDNIELEDIINSIYQRKNSILENEFKKLPFKIEGTILEKEIRYKELTRKSNRQKTKMNLGGVIGKITIENLDKESFELLKLGELIGVGKSTVFGLGKIEVIPKEG